VIPVTAGLRRPINPAIQCRIVIDMPEKRTLERARRDKEEGKSASTQAGEFVREELDHIREGKHGAKNTKQAIAIGLNKARRSGVDLKPPAEGRTSAKTRKSAQSASREGHSKKKATSSRRSTAVRGALKKMPKSAASRSALAKQARSAAKRRSASSRSAAAKKAARTRARERKAA
jgi:hypothetical protein